MAKFLNADGLTRLVALIKQALGGKQEKDFVVNVTESSNTLTADKTWTEISTAHNAGRNVVVDYNNFVYRLISFDNNGAEFATTSADGGDLMFSDLYVSSSNVWTDNTAYAQPELVSGTNIKTINNTSLLGSGNITLGAEDVIYSGDENYNLQAGDNLNESLDKLDSAIHNLGTPNEIASITATESSVSGGNNTVTITDTDGNSTSFNVKNGVNGQDGVSLGEISLVQTTGTATDAVMSQNAVTEYGRKVTAADLDGTSDWIKAKLEAQGWEFGKYVNTSGTLTANASYCATPYIEIGNLNNHSITFTYKFNSSSVACVVFYNDSGVKQNYWICNANTARTVTVTSVENATKIRISLNANDLRGCYIYDNTTGEYLFKSTPHIENALATDNATVGYGTFENYMLANELGTSERKAASQKVANDIQSNVDAIGRRSYGTTATFNANTAGLLMRSEKKYDTSSLPWVDVVTYNVQGGTGGASCRWFGFCPTITKDPQTANDYIGFKGSTWDCDFIIRRNGVAVYTASKALTSFSSSFIIGFRLDFRHKTLLLMKRQSNGTLWSSTIDLNSYDINLGKCYLYTSSGYCCYVADTYIGWNSSLNMTDFEAFFSNPMTAGKFKMFNEYTYPSDDIDGGVFAPFGQMMSTWNSTQDSNDHWVASFDSPSVYINMINSQPSVPSTHYLYTNWDLIIGIGKIKVVSGTLYLKAYSYYAIKDVYDLTDNVFLTATDGEYTIQEGHTIEVRGKIGANSKSHLFNVKGTCTLEMWDWEAHVSMNTNITPTNYDGAKVFGGIPFLNDMPNLVVDMPLIASSNYYVHGVMKYTSNKLYARVYDTSTNTFVDKQISNT